MQHPMEQYDQGYITLLGEAGFGKTNFIKCILSYYIETEVDTNYILVSLKDEYEDLLVEIGEKENFTFIDAGAYLYPDGKRNVDGTLSNDIVKKLFDVVSETIKGVSSCKQMTFVYFENLDVNGSSIYDNGHHLELLSMKHARRIQFLFTLPSPQRFTDAKKIF